MSEDTNWYNGERLYYSNLAHGFIKENKIEQKKKNEEESLTLQLAYKSKQTKNDNEKYSNIQSKLFVEPTPTNYISENETFQPNSHKQIKPKTSEEIKKLTDRLYTDGKIIEEKKNELAKTQKNIECPFTPAINVQGKADPKYFMKRLEKWNQKMEEKNKKLENENNDKNKILFHPKVDDPVAKKIKRDNNDVHSDLYKKGLEHKDYRIKIMKPDEKDFVIETESEKATKVNKMKNKRDQLIKERKEKFENEVKEREIINKENKEKFEKLIKEKDELLTKEKQEKQLLRQEMKNKEKEKEKLKSNKKDKEEIKKEDKKSENKKGVKKDVKKEIKQEVKKELKKIYGNSHSKDKRLKSANKGKPKIDVKEIIKKTQISHSVGKSNKDNKIENKFIKENKKEKSPVPKKIATKNEKIDIKKHNNKNAFCGEALFSQEKKHKVNNILDKNKKKVGKK